MPSEMRRLRQLEDENARLEWIVADLSLDKELSACSRRYRTPQRKVKAKLREHRQPASQPNDVRAMDFLHDQLFDRRKIRILVIMTAPAGSRRPWIRASPTRPQPLSRPLIRPARWQVIQRLSGSTTGRNCLPRPGSVGLSARRHPGLQPAGQADGQHPCRVH